MVRVLLRWHVTQVTFDHAIEYAGIEGGLAKNSAHSGRCFFVRCLRISLSHKKGNAMLGVLCGPIDSVGLESVSGPEKGLSQ